MTIESAQAKHEWKDNAIQIYSSEIRHWQEIKSYHQSRVDEADAKIMERYQIISDLEGKIVQPELPLDDPLTPLTERRFSVKGIIRGFHRNRSIDTLR